MAALEPELPEEDEDDGPAAGATQLQRSVFDWVHDDHSERAKVHQTISAEEVARTYGVPVKHLIQHLREEIEEAEACCSLPFTLLLVISYAVMAVAHDDAITIRAVEDSLKEDILQNANFAYTGYMGHKDMNDVNSIADFWSWMRLGMLPLLFQQSTSWHEGYEFSESYWDYNNISTAVPVNARGFWMTYNRIIGGMRMVQERDHTEGGECNTVPELLPLYNSDCVGGFDYDLEPELGLPNERAQVTILPTREQWVFAATNIDTMMEHMKKLEAEMWLDRQTKKVELAIPSYNAEFGLHTLTRVNFYFSRGGHIWKRIIPMSQYADWHDRWYYGVYDAIWILCLVYILGVEIIEVQLVVRSKGCCAVWTEYFHLWNIIDWMSVMGGVIIISFFLVSIDMRNDMNHALEVVGNTEFKGGSTEFQSNADIYLQALQDNVNYVRHLRLSVAVYPLIIIVRLFKSFSAQPKLALVTKTLSNAWPDLFHFAIVFSSVFVTFTICGIVLFGREVGSFTTWTRATISCFRVMLGDIDWDELSAIGRTEASIWLWLYIIIIVLLMLNMIIAIIMDHYEEVKADAGHAETLLEEGIQMFVRWRGRRNGTYVPLETVLDAVHDEIRRRKVRMHATAGAGNILHRVSFLAKKKTNEKLGNEKSNEKPPPPEDDGGEKGEGGEDPMSMCIDMDTLMRACSHGGSEKGGKMGEEQAMDVLKGAVEDFYEKNKQGAELDEVLQLTQKVNYRVKKLVQLARKAHDDRDTEPVKQLQWFAEDVDNYVGEIRKERKENESRLTALKQEKKELQQRLMSLGGGFQKQAEVSVNKRTSIMRTSSRMMERPPSE